MSKALVMAVYYSSSAVTRSWSALLPLRIRVDSGCGYINKYTFRVSCCYADI